MELDKNIDQKVKRLCAEGDYCAEQKNYKAASKAYFEAFELLPLPKNDWEAATWIMGAIGDVAFLAQKYNTARETLEYSMVCPKGLGNPFLHLRLGQVLFEQEAFDPAADHLARAYMGAGKEIFGSENPKYFEFLKTVLEPPANGIW